MTLVPAMARRLVRWLLPGELREDASDELDELYALRAARDGRLRARVWYWRQVLVFPLRMRLAMWAGGPLDAVTRSKGTLPLKTLWPHGLPIRATACASCAGVRGSP